MRYLASRSHRKYLRKLDELSQRKEAYSIVSVSGGLSFLHALSSRVRSLTLVDTDPEVNEYVAHVLEIIRLCESRSVFFEVLSGHRTVLGEDGSLTFHSERSPERSARSTALSAPSRQMLSECYREESFDSASCRMSSQFGTVGFFGVDLTPMHFNWMVDFGVFQSDKRYAEVRDLLLRVECSPHTIDLATVDFRSLDGPSLVLASNVESPLFTKGDPIVTAIEAAHRTDVYYVSRTRDFSLPSPRALPFAEEKLAHPPKAVGFDPLSLSLLQQRTGQEWEVLEPYLFFESGRYDEECVALCVDSLAAVGEQLAIMPIHQRLLLVGDPRQLCSLRLAWLSRYALSESFDLGPRRGDLYHLRHRTPYS